MTTQLISASLIYDGRTDVHVPDQLLPKAASKEEAWEMIKAKSQLQGQPSEVLCEVAGRACYDSLGAKTSRDTRSYHKHILDVKHLSTIEHASLNFNIHVRRVEHVTDFALMMLNRPNVWVRQVSPYDLRICMNLRHIMEWSSYKPAVWPLDAPATAEQLGVALTALARERAPMIIGDLPLDVVTAVRADRHPFDMPQIDIADSYAVAQLCPPEADEEKWVSIFMTGSRGFSHEQVRHGDWTAISQRSTRFVNEAESPWVEHPLITEYINQEGDEAIRAGNGEPSTLTLRQRTKHVVTEAQYLYKHLVGVLMPWLQKKGVDETSARKQARGAARGYLGNGLYTEVVFSASVAQWRRMLHQRLNQFADAEIREVYAAALPVLKACQYGDCFADMDVAPSPDGIGQVLKIGG